MVHYVQYILNARERISRGPQLQRGWLDSFRGCSFLDTISMSLRYTGVMCAICEKDVFQSIKVIDIKYVGK